MHTIKILNSGAKALITVIEFFSIRVLKITYSYKMSFSILNYQISGSKWHARLQDEKSQLVPSELPYFMIESYEECREPPQLYLLDKYVLFGND